MSEHTPGPWVVDDIGAGRAFAVRAGGERHAVAFTNNAALSKHACQHGIHGDAEQRANAHLLAAAPELLEALEAYRAKFGRCGPVADQADAAIKKAIGESQDTIESRAKNK